jgi:hypothetical protein
MAARALSADSCDAGNSRSTAQQGRHSADRQVMASCADSLAGAAPTPRCLKPWLLQRATCSSPAQRDRPSPPLVWNDSARLVGVRGGHRPAYSRSFRSKPLEVPDRARADFRNAAKGSHVGLRAGRQRQDRYGVSAFTSSAAGRTSLMRLTFIPAYSGPASTRLTGPSSVGG